MPGIRMHQLEGFFHVAQLGSYTKASQAFSYPIGQPAVYQQVKGLQEDLGLVLVRQAGPRRTEVTPEGRVLYEFLAPFFEGLPRVIERIKAGTFGPLILAADQFLAMETLPSALLAAQHAQPGLEVRLHELASQDVIQAVLSGEADAGLMHLLAVPPGIHWQPVGRIGVALLVPAQHPLAKLKRMPLPNEIAKHALIVYERASPGRILTERLFKKSGRRLIVAAEVTFSQTMRAMVRAGIAPAFVPFLLPNSQAPAGQAALPREPRTVSFDMSSRLKGGALPYGLIYRPGMEESLPLRTLSAALRAS